MSGDVRPTHHTAHATAAEAAADGAHTVIPRASDAIRVHAFYNTYATPTQKGVLHRLAFSLEDKGVEKDMIMKILFHACEHMQNPEANIAALDRMRDVCASGIMQSMRRERALELFDAQYPGDDIGRLIAFQEDTGMLPLAAESDSRVRKDFVTVDFSTLSEDVGQGRMVCLKGHLFRLPRALEGLEGDFNELHLDLNDLTYIPEWFHAVLPRFLRLTLVVSKAGIPDCFQHATNMRYLTVNGPIGRLPEWVNKTVLPKLIELDIGGNAFSPEAVYDIKKALPTVIIHANYQIGDSQEMNRFWLVLLFIWRLIHLSN